MAKVSYKFSGMNNVDDVADVGAPIPKIRQLIFTQGVELVNVDPDNDGGCALRPGQLRRYSGDVAAMGAADADGFYFQEGLLLKRLNVPAFTSTVIYVGLRGEVVFQVVNNVIVYTDGYVIRKIYRGADYPLPEPTQQFKIQTPAGQCLALFYRRLLVGVRDVLYVTDPDTVDQVDSRFCEFPMMGWINLIAPTDEGVFVSTDKGIYHLAGRGPLAWKEPGAVTRVADYPAISGTAVTLKAELTGFNNVAGNIAQFMTPRGVCYGLNNGMLVNVTEETVHPSGATRGTAVLREQGGLVHYLAVLRDAAEQFNTFTPWLYWDSQSTLTAVQASATY